MILGWLREQFLARQAQLQVLLSLQRQVALQALDLRIC